MAIYPLPQFEADLAAQEEADRKAYEALKAPKTVVVRYGAMKMIGEFPYDLDAKPGCGSKLVVRTHRGTELAEMLTSTCPNAGCSKSVTRKEMLEYIDRSGGREYPFSSEGRVLRIATLADLDKQARLEQGCHELKMRARAVVERAGVAMKIVDAEQILGEERLTFFFLSEDRVDFRDLVKLLGHEFRNRIEMRQVGARDEARLTADYEKCGQHCCCKQFLKVLKPISMKSAKVQKATLDPLKISGRCGRLMCCLRYEDETYESLKQRLPKKKTRVGTAEGDGLVIDAQILTQLVLVQLDEPGPDGKSRQVAVPVEDLRPPAGPAPVPGAMPPPRPPVPPDRRGPERQPRPDRPDRSAGGASRPTGDRPPGGPPERGPTDRGPSDRGGPRGGGRGTERGPDRGPRRGPGGPNRPSSDRPSGDRPSGDRPSGDRPRRPSGPDGSGSGLGPRPRPPSGPGGERRRRPPQGPPGGSSGGPSGGPPASGPSGGGGGSPSSGPAGPTPPPR